MGSLLSDIEKSYNNGEKLAYNILYDDYVFYHNVFSGTYVSKGKDSPYYCIWDLKFGINFNFGAYQSQRINGSSKGGYILKHWYDKEKDAYVIPSWVKFKVNYGASRKHPENNHTYIKVYRNTGDYKKVIFEDGLTESIKRFDTCIVEIIEYYF